MGCGAETKDLILKDQKGCIRGCEEFNYLRVKIDKKDRQENYIKKRINKSRAVTAILNSVQWNRQIIRNKSSASVRSELGNLVSRGELVTL